ncbi:transposase, partial [Persicirhabdus sediminis]|nr:transposase [Persicirhabdus sediminis]
MLAEIKAIHKDHNLKVYGSPRMTKELQARGWKCSENTVANIMRQHRIVAKPAGRFKPPKTTTVDKEAKYSPNLLENQQSDRFAKVL